MTGSSCYTCPEKKKKNGIGNKISIKVIPFLKIHQQQNTSFITLHITSLMVLKLRERQQHKKKKGRGLSWWSSGKNPPPNAGDMGSIPGQELRSHMPLGN